MIGRARLLKQFRLATVANAEMFVSQSSGDASSGCTVEKPDLDEKRLVDFFQGVGLFRQGCGQGIQSYRATTVFLNDGQHQAAINLIEPMLIYFEHVERGLGGDLVDSTVTSHLGKVPYPAQQTVGNSRGASGPVGKLGRAFVVNLDTQDLGGALNDEFQL